MSNRPDRRLSRAELAEAAAAPEPQTVTTVGSLPATVNLVLYEGDDFYLDLTVTDSLGAAVDLTLATAKAEIRQNPTATTVMARFTTSTAANVVSLHLPASEAAKLTGQAVWDCQIETPDVTTLVAGTVSVTPQVTE